ncbi:hypothetical protein C8J57DRAFT_1373704 [Mycena rebaudengoi]|nr:hypothetical protein C8J57DRAFT_1373704 [Mycena rebaudengoi]
MSSALSAEPSTIPTTTTIYRLTVLAMALALGLLSRAFHRRSKDTRRAQADVLALRQALERKDNEIRQAIERKDSEVAVLQRSMDAAKSESVALAEEVARLRDAEAEKRVLEEELEAQRRRGDVGEAEKERVAAAYEEAVGMLAARTADLEEARARLQVVGDRVTVQGVLEMVRGLNTEISETAAVLADSFEFEEKDGEDGRSSAEDTGEEMTEAYERATEILGHDLVAILRIADHHEDPTLVRLGFQGGMIEYARWMSASWFFEDPEDEQLLADIYQRVRTGQDQAVAGRWRALTHRHVQELIDGEPELGDYFVDAFVNVLLTAGLRGGSVALHELVATRFAGSIARLVRLALTLNNAVGAEVTVCELKTLSVAPGSPFDGDAMIEATGTMPEPGETVLCTCELGLSRADKIDGVWRKTTLLKPRVIVQSGLEELNVIYCCRID